MLGVLLGLLGGSLGFAQWLVVSRQVKPVLTVELERFGFTGGVEGRYTDEVEGRMGGLWRGGPRRVDVFVFPEVGPTGGGIRIWGAASEGAKELYMDIMGDPPDDLKVAELGGNKGVEATGMSEEGRFAWMRFALFNGHAGAICYSGVGKFTDADRKVFEEMCATGVKFRDAGR